MTTMPAAPYALVLEPSADRWSWSLNDADRVAASGQAPNRTAALRSAELTAAALGAFSRIARRRF